MNEWVLFVVFVFCCCFFIIIIEHNEEKKKENENDKDEEEGDAAKSVVWISYNNEQKSYMSCQFNTDGIYISFFTILPQIPPPPALQYTRAAGQLCVLAIRGPGDPGLPHPVAGAHVPQLQGEDSVRRQLCPLPDRQRLLLLCGDAGRRAAHQSFMWVSYLCKRRTINRQQMWSHQAKAVTWVYVTRSESAQSADALIRHNSAANYVHPSEQFCLVAPQMFTNQPQSVYVCVDGRTVKAMD